jgi:hypothetical protein
MRRGVVALAALLVGCGGFAAASAATTGEQTAKAFTIGSNLDGRTVLPHRIPWIAHASAPVLFPGVEFLIDGKVVFANRLEPYAFGADGRDEASGTTKTGYLVTSFLAPGKHRFTVRGKAIVGRVPAPPAPPAQLAGTWQRQLETAVPPDPNRLYRAVTAQPGTYRLVVDRRYLRLSGPAPRKHLKIDYLAGPRTLVIRCPVWTGDPDEGAACDPWGPEATYAWSVSEGTLTLEPAGKGDECKQRGAITTGEWTRVG